MESAIVTGAAGFVGSAIVRALAERDVRVRALVHPRTDVRRLEDLGSQVSIDRIDLLDVEGLREIVSASPGAVVFHAAARGRHPTDESSRAAGWRDTVQTTIQLWEAMEDSEVERVVHLGSSLEYGDIDPPFREDHVLRPTTSRGTMKAAAGLIAQQRGRELGIAVTNLRLFSVYGPGEQSDRVVPTLIRCLLTGRPFSLTAQPSRRDFVFIDDVVGACLLAAGPGADGETVNIGTGTETSIPELAQAAERSLGIRLVRATDSFVGNTVDLERSCADTAKASELLGWRATTTLADGLALTAASASRSIGAT